MYEKGEGGPLEWTRANEFYDQGCELGDGRGCNNLGNDYANGDGVPRDRVRANALYERGCALGNAGGCVNLGESHRKGVGAAKNLERAVELFGKACEMGTESDATISALPISTGSTSPRICSARMRSWRRVAPSAREIRAGTWG
jgi:TPR repeat protein